MAVMGQLQLNNYPLVVSRRIHQISVHENYTHNFYFDVAVLVLDYPVPSDHEVVRPIALARLGVEADTLCQVTGWGTQRFVRQLSYCKCFEILYNDAICRETKKN